MSNEFYTICERLLSATANGVYQGVLIALLAGLALRFARTNAATRHAVWFAVLLLVAALIPAHVLMSSLAQYRLAATTENRPVVISTEILPLDSGTFADVQPDANHSQLAEADPDQAEDSDLIYAPDDRQDAPSDSSTKTELASYVSLDPIAPVPAPQSFVSKILSSSLWKQEAPIHLPRSICLGLVLTWLALAGLRGSLIAMQLRGFRLAKKISWAPCFALQRLFDKLRNTMTTRRNVRLKISTAHSSAVLLGFAHPVVLLPREMDNDPDEIEVEHVLRHELAHVERRDDWCNLAQQVLEAALFFHPAVWWISKRLTLEREIACDDHVLEASGRPRAYALTLANIASRMNQCRQSLAPGVSNNNSQLQQRITMILNTHRDRSPRLVRSRLGLFTAAAAIAGVFAIAAGPRLVLAGQSVDTAPAPGAALSAQAPVEVLVADSQPAPAVPDLSSDIETQPRIKTSIDTGVSVSVAPRVLASPVPEAPVLIAAPPEPVAPLAPMAPDAPPAPRPQGKRHGSIEERLDRIERILDGLQARGDMRKNRDWNDGGSYSRSGNGEKGPMAMNIQDDFAFKWSADEAKRIAEETKREVEQGHREAEQAKREAEQGMREAKHEAEQAQREAQQAQREAQQAQREAEQAQRDSAKEKSQDLFKIKDDMRHLDGKDPGIELQALRSARESLQSEVKNLERQIKHLEEERDSMKKLGRSGDGKDSQSDKPADGR